MTLRSKTIITKMLYIGIQPLFMPVLWQVRDGWQRGDWSAIIWFLLAEFLYTLDAVLLLWILKK